MARGNMEQKHGRCPDHGMTKVERPAIVFGGGDLLMVVCTVGLWLLVKYSMQKPWRCAECGKKAQPT